MNASIEFAQAPRRTQPGARGMKNDPHSWTTKPLAELAKAEWGNTSITKASYVESGFPAFSATGADGFLPKAEWEGPAVVLSAIGARCGKCFYADGKWTAIKNTIVIQADSSTLSHKFLFYYLNDATRWKISGSGQPFITLKTVRETKVPSPPLSEQDETVAEIEKQFTRLDAGVAALRRVQANLKRYRAAVLKAACEGRLVPTEVELAKAESRSFETGEELLARILSERRRNWKGRGKYKEPVATDTANLGPLPEGWTWATADQISSQITDGEHIQPKYTDHGYPMLSAKHVRNGFVVYADTPFISETDFKACLKRCAPTRDDILIVCVGATTGRAAIVGDAKPFAVVRSVLLIRTLIHPRFLLAWAQSPRCQTWIQSASGSSAQAHFYINNAKQMYVPLPPVAEQTRIVAEVERRLSVVEELEAAVVAANLQRATSLRQSILNRAFNGGFSLQN